MWRPLALLLALALSACRQPTEIVLRLDTMGGDPPLITVKLQRSTGFDANAETPPFVESVLDGAALDLLVTPQGAETVLSLLPPKNGPSDLAVSASAPGFLVEPPDPFAAMFKENESQSLRFILTAEIPDMSKPVKDGGAKDSGAKDGGKG